MNMAETLDRLPSVPAGIVGARDIADYRRDGVVCLRGLFHDVWLEPLREAAFAVMASGAGRVREPCTGTGKGRFYSNVYVSELDPRFSRLCRASPAPYIAAKLLGADRIRFFYDQLFIKMPGAAAPTPWHNDLPFWPFEGEDLLSIWIALSPVTRETGGLQYVAGSHRWNKRFRAITPDKDPRFIDESMEPCPDYGNGEGDPGARLLCWDLEPGDVLCHHPLTVHGASGNSSSVEPRIGVSLRYLGNDVRWQPRTQAMVLRRDPAVLPGSYPADNAALPVVWERARGLVALDR